MYPPKARISWEWFLYSMNPLCLHTVIYSSPCFNSPASSLSVKLEVRRAPGTGFPAPRCWLGDSHQQHRRVSKPPSASTMRIPHLLRCPDRMWTSGIWYTHVSFSSRKGRRDRWEWLCAGVCVCVRRYVSVCELMKWNSDLFFSSVSKWPCPPYIIILMMDTYHLFILVIHLFVFLCMSAPMANGNSQAGVDSDLPLQPRPQPQQCRILKPLSEARDQTRVLMDTVLGSLPTGPQWELLSLLQIWCLAVIVALVIFHLLIETHAACGFHSHGTHEQGWTMRFRRTYRRVHILSLPHYQSCNGPYWVPIMCQALKYKVAPVHPHDIYVVMWKADNPWSHCNPRSEGESRIVKKRNCEEPHRSLRKRRVL